MLKAPAIILLVIGTALLGGLLGGLFGWGAGTLAPDLFSSIVPWKPSDQPVGIAVVVGSFGGVMCGGALGAFAVAVQAFGRRRRPAAADR